MNTPTRLHQRRRRRGNNAVEFALCMPIWILTVIGIMDFAWFFFQMSSLDAAAFVGCREGSLIDPGDNDANIDEVESTATFWMEANLLLIPSDGDECPQCDFNATTDGDPPIRTLICTAQREISPLIGMFMSPQVMQVKQIARLEWQREAAP